MWPLIYDRMRGQEDQKLVNPCFFTANIEQNTAFWCLCLNCTTLYLCTTHVHTNPQLPASPDWPGSGPVSLSWGWPLPPSVSSSPHPLVVVAPSSSPAAPAFSSPFHPSNTEGEKIYIKRNRKTKMLMVKPPIFIFTLICDPTLQNESHWYFSRNLDFYTLVKSSHFPFKWYQNYATRPTGSKVIEKSIWLP